MRAQIVWIIIIIMQMPLHFIGMCDSLHLYTRVLLLLPPPYPAVGDDDGFVGPFRFISFLYLIHAHNQRYTQRNALPSLPLSQSYSSVQNSRGNLPTTSLTQMHILLMHTSQSVRRFRNSGNFQVETLHS